MPDPKYTILVTATNGIETRWYDFDDVDDALDTAEAMHLSNRYVREVEVVELEPGDRFND